MRAEPGRVTEYGEDAQYPFSAEAGRSAFHRPSRQRNFPREAPAILKVRHARSGEMARRSVKSRRSRAVLKA